jgi:small subunit ribosomal protein S6
VAEEEPEGRQPSGPSFSPQGDLMSARTYELIYILKPEANEQEVGDLQAQIEAVIQRLGGTLEKTEAWGRRRLAYEIGKHKEGFYVLHVIAGSGGARAAPRAAAWRGSPAR